MQFQKRGAMLFLILLLFCSMSMAAYAHEVPDASKKGSVTVTMTYKNKAVAGGKLTLYRVGAVAEDDGNYGFVLTGDFTGSGISLENIQSARLAKKLADYVGDHKITGKAGKIGNDGKVSFSKLELGLYLLVQTDAADGYLAADPFLVSVPMHEDGAYDYDVDATPKVEMEKESGSTSETPESPKEPSSSTETKKPSSPTLPQTGQLNWPVPVLCISGLLLFAIGWLLKIDAKKDTYEV